jgi:hypothetical protein
MLVVAIALPCLVALVAVAIDRLFILSPLFHFALFFGLFISPQLVESSNGPFEAVTLLGAVAFTGAYTLARRSPLAGDDPVTRPDRATNETFVLRISHTMIVLAWLAAIVATFVGTSITQGIDVEKFLACPICETSRTGKENVAAPMLVQFAVFGVMDYLSWTYLRQNPSYRRASLLGLLRTIAYLGSFGTGRVLVLVNFFLPPVLAFAMKDERVTRTRQLALLGLGTLAIIPALFAMNELRHGYSEVEFAARAALVSFVTDLSPGANLKALISHVDTYGFDHGFFLLSPAIALIPRALFPSKPITSLQFYYTQRLFYEDPLEDQTTYTFTMFDSYTAFGLVSLVLVSAFYGLLFARIHRTAVRSAKPWATVFCLEMCLLCVNIFRTNLFDAAAILILRLVLLYAAFSIIPRIARAAAERRVRQPVSP